LKLCFVFFLFLVFLQEFTILNYFSYTCMMSSNEPNHNSKSDENMLLEQALSGMSI
jgi:hypothetical protein